MDEEVQSPGDDWRVHLYNQERMLSSQEEISTVLRNLLENQQNLRELAVKLHVNLDELTGTLQQTAKTTSGLVGGVIKVPIAMTVVGVASWAFLYENQISETTWLIMLGVAVFPWLGESITAVAKLVGVGRQQVNGEKFK
jgi:hypothetical protein